MLRPVFALFRNTVYTWAPFIVTGVRESMVSRSVGFRLVALGAGFVVASLMGEVMVRLMKPQQTYAVLLEKGGSYYAPSPFNPFTLKQNYSGIQPSQEYPGNYVDLTTNSLRLRGREIDLAKPENTKRILVLGDSYTFGVFVEDYETYSAVLERLFAEDGRGAVEVLNAGYSDGWETDEHYSWLVNRGLDFEPDVVVLGFFIGNDIVNIVPENWVEVDERGLPTRIVDDSFYIDPIGRLRAVTHLNNRSVGDQAIYRLPGLRDSHVAVLVGLWIDRAIRHVYDRPPFGPPEDRSYQHIFKKQSSFFDKKEQHFLKLIQGLRQVTAERGIEFLVLMIPFNFQVNPSFLDFGWQRFGRIQRNYFEDLKPRLDSWGIPHVDLLKLMREDPGCCFPRNGEVHFNPRGHEFVAHELKAKLDQLGWFDEQTGVPMKRLEVLARIGIGAGG